MHNHSHYSLLDGMTTPQEMARIASDYGQKAIAITDHGRMGGVFQLQKACSEVGIKPIFGSEIYYTPSIEQDNEDKSRERFHLILLAKNQAGLEKMFKVQQKSWTKPNFYFKPRVDWSDLEFLGSDIIILSGCMAGQLARFLEAGEQSQAAALVEQFSKRFASNYFVEIQPWNHGNLNEQLLDLASSFNLPVVGTLDCHYPTMNDAGVEELMLMMNQHSSLKPADDRYAKEHAHEAIGHTDIIAKINAMYPNRFLQFHNIQPYLMSFDEVKARFGDLASVQGIFENTEEIADRCNTEIVKHKSLLPKYSKTFESADLLRELAFDGLNDLNFAEDNMYVQRLNFEIDTIIQLGYADYFLIVWDLCNYADKVGIARGPGRGSVCGSLLAYCLNITEVDPIKYGLLFSRFLNSERVSPPDIDMDFSSVGRDHMKDYAARRWGEDNVASISAYTVHKPKKAVKNILKVYSVPFKEANAITPLFETMDEFKSARKTQDIIKKYPEIVSVVERIEGRICEDGVHAAGVVIADRPLWKVCPVESRGLRGADDRKKTIALDMEQAEEIGLWKFDFLAITALDVIYNSCISKIQELYGIDVRPQMKTYDDEKVLHNFNSDSLVGIFQAEGAGYKSLLEQMTIDDFNDLVASNALVRPGAMNVHGKNYVGGKKGKLISVHPLMESIVAETYNCVIYQEQLMAIVMAMADFTEGEADYLRKIIGKKRDAQEFERFEGKWMGGATRYISESKAKEMWRGFERASEYAFNKSHAVAYSMLSYWTMWLKTYYTKEFIWACLANETNATTIATLLNDAARLGVKLLPPDINYSDKFMSIDKDGIRFGLTNIAGLGDTAADEVISRRPYTSFEEFKAKVSKSKVKVNILENLEKIGAFASVGHDSGFDAKKYYLPILNCSVYEEDDDRFRGLITPLSDAAESNTLNVVRGMVKSVKRKPNYFRVEMEDSSAIASFFAADRSADIKARDYIFALAGASNILLYSKDIEQDSDFRNFILSTAVCHENVPGIVGDKRLGIAIGVRKFKTKTGRDMGELWLYDPVVQDYFKLTVFPDNYDKLNKFFVPFKKLVVRVKNSVLENAIEYERYLEIAK